MSAAFTTVIGLADVKLGFEIREPVTTMSLLSAVPAAAGSSLGVFDTAGVVAAAPSSLVVPCGAGAGTGAGAVWAAAGSAITTPAIIVDASRQSRNMRFRMYLIPFRAVDPWMTDASYLCALQRATGGDLASGSSIVQKKIAQK
jgi:hypothetical protein